MCPLATSAPALDLELFENLNNYKSIDQVVAESALSAFRRHMWYLHGEMVPIPLWQTDLSEERKAVISKKIIEQKKTEYGCCDLIGRFGVDFVKPDSSDVNTAAKELDDLLTPASWSFFEILGFSTDFLELSPNQWQSNEDFVNAGEALRHFKVTNEDAERSVKLCADFLETAKKEKHQDTLQVVEAERKKTPDVRKSVKRKVKN